VVGHSCHPDTTFALQGETSKGKTLCNQILARVKRHKDTLRYQPLKFLRADLFFGRFRGTFTGPEERRLPTKRQKKRPAKNQTRFRPGTSGECEAQLWRFTGPQGIFHDDNAAEVHWVAAESLEAALHYMRRRYDDFNIGEARFLGMIPLLSGSPLD